MVFRSLTTISLLALLNLSMSARAADSLAEIYKLAVQNDPTIRAAEATFKAGLEAENLGRSGLLPQINAAGSTGANKVDSKGETPTPFINPDFQSDSTNSDFEFSLDQAVLDMSTWFSFKQGQELSQQAQAQFAADQQDLIIRVAESYFGVLRALDNLSASRGQETANQRQLDQTQQRFDVGLIAITDVHESQAAFDLSRATRLSDEGALGVALERLTLLTGQVHENVWLLKEDYPVIDPDPINKDEWVDFAMSNNNNVKATAFGRDAADQNARASKAEHYPKISARLGYGGGINKEDRDSDDPLFSGTSSGNNRLAGASLNLKIPLYSGGFISASRRQAYEQFNTAQENYAGVVRTTIQTTRALHLQSVVDVATTKARRLAITSSQSAYDATQAGYEVGTRNIVDVLNVQQNLFNAIRDYANARYDYVIDMLRLKNVAGIISPEDVYNLNEWLIPPTKPTLSNTKLTP